MLLVIDTTTGAVLGQLTRRIDLDDEMTEAFNVLIRVSEETLAAEEAADSDD